MVTDEAVGVGIDCADLLPWSSWKACRAAFVDMRSPFYPCGPFVSLIVCRLTMYAMDISFGPCIEAPTATMRCGEYGWRVPLPPPPNTLGP